MISFDYCNQFPNAGLLNKLAAIHTVDTKFWQSEILLKEEEIFSKMFIGPYNL